ncbi:FAD-binding oxidoreductase [Bradyrhizobium sp. 172]|nr:FAD-binding oxidoreductase [Bradyrhizobium sp. 172]
MIARANATLFPLGACLDDEPWMACRPSTPDMLPIIGPAPRHSDMWFAFGHAHHGLTLGPVTGRLIAELITGTETVCGPAPFRVERFRVEWHASVARLDCVAKLRLRRLANRDSVGLRRHFGSSGC